MGIELRVARGDADLSGLGPGRGWGETARRLDARMAARAEAAGGA